MKLVQEGPTHPTRFESKELNAALKYETLRWQDFSGSSEDSTHEQSRPKQYDGAVGGDRKQEKGGLHLGRHGGRDEWATGRLDVLVTRRVGDSAT